MSELYETGAEGERALAEYLRERGHEVEPSDDKTFDLIVDGQPAEVKSSQAPYDQLGFVGLTDNQYQMIEDGVDFSLFLVCNLANPESLEVIEIPAQDLFQEEPTVESTYYWYRSQLERIRNEP